MTVTVKPTQIDEDTEVGWFPQCFMLGHVHLKTGRDFCKSSTLAKPGHLETKFRDICRHRKRVMSWTQLTQIRIVMLESMAAGKQHGKRSLVESQLAMCDIPIPKKEVPMVKSCVYYMMWFIIVLYSNLECIVSIQYIFVYKNVFELTFCISFCLAVYGCLLFGLSRDPSKTLAIFSRLGTCVKS